MSIREKRKEEKKEKKEKKERKKEEKKKKMKSTRQIGPTKEHNVDMNTQTPCFQNEEPTSFIRTFAKL